MGGEAMLRFSIRQEAPHFFWVSLDGDYQIAPSVVTIDLSIVLLDTLVRVQNVVKPGTVHREFSSPNHYVYFTPSYLVLTEVSLDADNRFFECPHHHFLLFCGIYVNFCSGVSEEA